MQPNNVFMLHFLHYVDLGLNTFNVIGIGEDFLIDNFDSCGHVIRNASSQVHSGIGALPNNLIERKDVLFDFLFPFLEGFVVTRGGSMRIFSHWFL